MLSTSIVALALLGATSVAALAPRVAAASKCNADNCYRAFTNTPSAASAFCSTYLQPTTVITITPTVTISGTTTITPPPPSTVPAQSIPSHLSSQCVLATTVTLPVRLSSVCSCLSISPKSSTVTSTAFATAQTVTFSTTTSSSACVTVTATNTHISTSYSDLDTTVSQYSTVISTITYLIDTTVYGTTTSTLPASITTSTIQQVTETTIFTTSVSGSTLNIFPTTTITGATSTTTVYAISTSTVYTFQPVKRDMNLAPRLPTPAGCTVTVSTDITVGTVSATGQTSSVTLFSTSYASSYTTETITSVSTVYTTPTSTFSTIESSTSTDISTVISYTTLSVTGDDITVTSTPIVTSTVISSISVVTAPVTQFIIQAYNTKTGAVSYLTGSGDSFIVQYTTDITAASLWQLDVNTNGISLARNHDLIIYVRPGSTYANQGVYAFVYSATQTSNLGSHSALSCTIDLITGALSCRNLENVTQAFLRFINGPFVYTCAAANANQANAGPYTTMKLTAIPVPS